MTMNEIIAQLRADDNADNLRLNDGAITWDLDNLIEALRDGDFDFTADEWSWSANGIVHHKEDGYAESVNSWTFEYACPHCGDSHMEGIICDKAPVANN